MSAVYDKAKESFLTQSPALVVGTDTIKAAIGRTSAYTFSASHQYKSSVATVQAAASALTSVTCTNGQYDAADSTFVSVAAGAAVDFVTHYKDAGGADTANPVVTYIDGFSIVPNGGDITAVYDSGTNRIFHV